MEEDNKVNKNELAELYLNAKTEKQIISRVVSSWEYYSNLKT